MVGLGCVGMTIEGVAPIAFQYPGKIEGEGIWLQLINIATLPIPLVQRHHKYAATQSSILVLMLHYK